VSGFVLPSLFSPILDVIFGIGAVITFANLIIAFYRAVTFRFTPMDVLKIVVYAFIFVICLDWVAGFNFFKNTFAPLVWNLLNSQ
jgi:hypothetical protein